MAAVITVEFNIGDKIKRVVPCGANMTHGCGSPTIERLSVQEITIIAGTPINKNKTRFQYTCFNETKGRFETFDEDEIKEYSPA